MKVSAAQKYNFLYFFLFFQAYSMRELIHSRRQVLFKVPNALSWWKFFAFLQFLAWTKIAQFEKNVYFCGQFFLLLLFLSEFGRFVAPLLMLSATEPSFQYFWIGLAVSESGGFFASGNFFSFCDCLIELL